MITIKDNKSLNQAISFLENQQKSEAFLLKEHFEFTKEQLNPVNLIKEKFQDAVHNPSVKGAMVKGALGMASGFLAKKFILGSGSGIFAKIARKALPAIASALIMKVPGNAKQNGISFLQKTLGKLKI